jgi:hypothetical protein
MVPSALIRTASATRRSWSKSVACQVVSLPEAELVAVAVASIVVLARAVATSRVLVLRAVLLAAVAVVVAAMLLREVDGAALRSRRRFSNFDEADLTGYERHSRQRSNPHSNPPTHDFLTLRISPYLPRISYNITGRHERRIVFHPVDFTHFSLFPWTSTLHELDILFYSLRSCLKSFIQALHTAGKNGPHGADSSRVNSGFA